MQAARGASVADDAGGPEAVTTGSAGRRRTAWALFLGVTVVFLVLDQVSKWFALERLTRGEAVPVLGDVLQLHLTSNPGAAFSLGTEFTVGLTCLAIAATVAILWVSRRLRDRTWAVALGVMLAGVDGNLYDRMFREPGPFRGHVIDFLKLPSWPVFNIADICINVGAALVLLQVFRGVRLDGTRHHDERQDEREGGADGEAGAG